MSVRFEPEADVVANLIVGEMEVNRHQPLALTSVLRRPAAGWLQRLLFLGRKV